MRDPFGEENRFIANVKAARTELDMKQSTLGGRMKDLGFTSWTGTMVAATETGFRGLKLREAIGLSRILGVPFDRMTTETPTRIRAIVHNNLLNGVTR